MRTTFLPVLLALGILASCGGKSGSDASAQTDTTATATAKAEPLSLGNGIPVDYDITVSGHRYKITICCLPDKAAPAVMDEMGQAFYPNKVDVSVEKDGAPLLAHTFVKSDFAAHLSEAEQRGTVLQGMNQLEEKSDASYLHFTALVGEPGMDGGVPFLIKVSTENGSYSIARSAPINETATAAEEMEMTD